MGEWKGPKKGVGNKNSGRKTDAEIVAKYVNMNLANCLYNDRLQIIADKKPEERKDEDIKEFVRPVVLKGITEKTENTIILPKPIIQLDVQSDNSNEKNNITKEED